MKHKHAHGTDRKTLWSVIAASSVGTLIEWYDFFIFGSLATIPLPARLQGRPPTGKIDAEQLALYDQFGIEVPFNRIQGRRYFRVSAQIYNQPADYDYLAAALTVSEP